MTEAAKSELDLNPSRQDTVIEVARDSTGAAAQKQPNAVIQRGHTISDYRSVAAAVTSVATNVAV